MNYFLLTGLLSIPALVLGWDQSRRRKAAKRVLKFLETLETKYLNLRNQHLAISMSSQGFETEKMREFIEKVMVILKPEIDALVSEASLFTSNKAYIKPIPTHFPNALSLINEWSMNPPLRKAQKSVEGENDFSEKLRQAIKDSIAADIEGRILNWEAGKPLE